MSGPWTATARLSGHGVVVCAALGWACAPDGRAPNVTVVDSAGIEIVTNHTLEAPEWWVAEVPRLDLGTVDEEGPEQFYRVADATVLSDGTLAVADGGSREIRIFDARGRHLRSFGREGEGPGEFGVPAEITEMPADTLTIWDARLRRFSLFDRSGSPVRTYLIPEGLLNPQLVGTLPDGRSILGDPWFDFSGGSGERFRQIYSRYALVSAEGELLDTLPRQPYGLFGDVGDLMGGPHFDARSRHAAASDGYWVGAARHEQVTGYRAHGRLRRIVRWPPGERRVTQADVDALMQSELASSDPERHPRIRQRYASVPASEVFPTHAQLLIDRTGALWVQEYARPGHEGPLRWMVFDVSGALAAYVRMPEALRVLEIGADYVLGVYSDELGVEHVQVRELGREAT